jgi:hypothetical protein
LDAPTSRTIMSSFHALTDPTHTGMRSPAVLELMAVAGSRLASVSAYEHPTTTQTGGAGYCMAFTMKLLLRKEVIQPHLPVRLPCYDFVPIASPTFDGSLPYGLGHRLRVLPTFVT